jgi:hypothetical protein
MAARMGGLLRKTSPTAIAASTMFTMVPADAMMTCCAFVNSLGLNST